MKRDIRDTGTRFLLAYHVRPGVFDSEEATLLGIFLDREPAEETVVRCRTLPPFSETPGEFDISGCAIGAVGWRDGYCKEYF